MAKDVASFALVVATPQGFGLQREINCLELSTSRGDLALMAGATPLMAKLREGPAVFRVSGKKEAILLKRAFLDFNGAGAFISAEEAGYLDAEAYDAYLQDLQNQKKSGTIE